MPGTEKARLRLLATLSASGVRFAVEHLSGLDRSGQALLVDWCRVVGQADLMTEQVTTMTCQAGEPGETGQSRGTVRVDWDLGVTVGVR